MKASELEHAMSCLAEDDDVEFIVNDSNHKEPSRVAEPTHAQIETEVRWPERGELTPIPNEYPRTMVIHLEI